MSDERNRATIHALIHAINRGDRDALDAVFADDVVMDWPQSGERIRGAENRREVYRRFPSLPKVSERRLLCQNDLCVLEADLEYEGGDTYQCVFIFEMRAGQVARETAYWTKPFPAPEWRAPWVERIS